MSSKQVMVSGYYGFENLGDELILQVMTDQLKLFGFKPLVLSENPEYTAKTYGVDSIHRTEIHHIWRAMKHVHSFISGGGGLFQDSTGLGSPIYYGGLIEMARWHKLQVAFFGQGVGPLRSAVGQWFTKRAISHSDIVVLRDAKSQAVIRHLTGIKPYLMADPVWLWEPDESLTKAIRKGLGVSLRPCPELKTDEIEHIANCISYLSASYNGEVNMIDCQPSADILPLAKLEQFLKKKGISCQWFSESTLLQGIAQSEALIGMRYHAVLTAAKLDIPVVAVSYDPKVQILASQLKISDFPITSLRKSFTIESFKDAALFPADIDKIQKLKNEAQRGFDFLKSFLGR